MRRNLYGFAVIVAVGLAAMTGVIAMADVSKDAPAGQTEFKLPSGWTEADMQACILAGTAFLYLAFVSPPWSPWWRIFGMALVGLAAGMLHTAIFTAISPAKIKQLPASTMRTPAISPSLC